MEDKIILCVTILLCAVNAGLAGFALGRAQMLRQLKKEGKIKP